METPFIFGRIARDKNFTDREKETVHLAENFKSLINTMIISPRRWGKSSLVEKAADTIRSQNKSLRIIHIDLFSIRNEEQFYEMLAMEVLKGTSSKWEEAVKNAKNLLKQVVPKIILSADLKNEFSLNFDWNELKRNPEEVLDLAEKIAAIKGLKIVICIDEFQNIGEFDDPLFFQRRLRSHWQKHRNVSYCLYGSKRHMLLDVFTNPSMPFFKFGDIVLLEKIDTISWIGFLSERFSATGKTISDEQSELIVKLADNHPYYVQQLAQQCWLRTEEKCSENVILEAHSTLIDQLSLLFSSVTETLTTNHLGFLKALLAGERLLSSSEVLTKYHLTSSANVTRARNSMIERDILDQKEGALTFQDPMYRFWLANRFFKMPES